jgi:hypothetical protein
MTPPSNSVRGELNAALISGIRRHGSDAVGLVIIGIARLVIGVSTFCVLLGVGAIFGYEVTASHLAGATVVAVLVGWLTAGRRPASS